jgi:putative ABC transport system permease protein
LRSLFLRNRVEAELDQEFAFHLERQTQENIRAGLAPAEAERAARRSLDGIAQQKELCRETRGTRVIENFLRDLRYALRAFARSPGFSTIVILTLAVGIGANTAIFSLLDATLLRPLPYPEANQIVALSEADREGNDLTVSWPDFVDWRNQSRSFSAIAALRGSNFNLTGNGEAERLHGLRVSASFLSVLGVHPLLGRDFLDSDDRPGAVPAVMLSNALWLRRFGGDPRMIGRNIILDGCSYSVAGVLPADFRFVYARDVYVPVGLGADQEPNRGVRDIARVLARLKPGVSIGTAAVELKTIGGRLAEAYPEYDRAVAATLRPFAELVAAPAKQGLLTIAIAVGFLLMIACANVASLLLARASSRQREIAVRIALGAGRRRLMAQLLTESGLLAFAGAAAGCVLAAAILPLLVPLVPMDQGEMEQYIRATLNLRVLSFTVGLTLFTTVLFGLAPAWRMSPAEPGTLGSGMRATSGGPQKFTLRNLLVTGQIALAVVLLAGAGLLTQSLLRLLNTNLGFRADHLLTARLKLPTNRYADTDRRAAFFESLIQRIDAIPSVAAASGATCAPLAGKDCWPSVFVIDGPLAAGKDDMLHAHFNAVGPDYLKAMQIPLIRGRDLDKHDDLPSQTVVVVNESFVREFFPQTDPLGRRIRQGYAGDKNVYQIVGVVGDARRDSPDVPPAPEAFMTVSQIGPDALELVIRTRLPNPLLIAPEIVRAARELDPDVPIYDLRSMEWYVDYQTTNRRFPTLVLAAFAGLALLLAGVGLYGLISYVVAQRTQEFGIRMAPGARASDVTGIVMKQGLWLVGAGLLIGLAGAWAMTRFIAALLFATRPDDGLTLVGISCALAVVAAMACWLPARRAAVVDPAITLRTD